MKTDWPSRRVTIVVPSTAGTGSDVGVRILAKELSDVYRQPFIVENRPGAGQTLGSAYVSRAAPDGYTLLVGGNTSHSGAKAFLVHVPYDPIKDFTPIARIAAFPILAVTNTQQPFKTVQGFLDFAKQNPGKLSYGFGNASGEIVMEAIKSRFSLDIQRIPYRGNPQALVELLGNRIQLVVADFPNAIVHIKNGTIVGLALPALTRSSLLPDVPTFNETAIPGFEVQPWAGLYGPAKLPSEIAKDLSEKLNTILKNPDVVRRMLHAGLDPYYLPVEQFGAFSESQVGVWMSLAKNAGIVAQ